MRAVLFLDGKYRAEVCRAVTVQDGRDDRDLASAILRLTQALLSDPAPDPAPPQATAAAEADEHQGFWERDVASGDWGGLRSRLEDQGVSIGIDWVMEGFNNFRGGHKNGHMASSTLDADLSLDLEKLAGVRGAEFNVDLEDHAGRNPSSVLVGDIRAPVRATNMSSHSRRSTVSHSLRGPASNPICSTSYIPAGSTRPRRSAPCASR